MDPETIGGELLQIVEPGGHGYSAPLLESNCNGIKYVNVRFP